MRFGLILALPLLAACGVEQSADALARASAKTYINSVVAANFPGVDATPITDCIIDNATTVEAITIAQAALVGGNLDTAENIMAIASRPATVGCITEKTLAQGLAVPGI